METLKDFWAFMNSRKKFWLLPALLLLFCLSALLVFSSGSAVAPFIYTIF